MTELAGRSAVITGATQGIGHAIAAALVSAGVNTTLLGRSRTRLEAAMGELAAQGPGSVAIAIADLADSASITRFANEFRGSAKALHVLVNCGGHYESGPWHDTLPNDFKKTLETNVVGPGALIQSLLPLLIEGRGDVVFINSSIVRNPGGGAGVFAASQHALRAVADSLRSEVNQLGVRVLSVYPGRTATPRQQMIHETASQSYQPERLLQPADIADAVVACLRLNDTAEVTDLHLRQRYKA